MEFFDLCLNVIYFIQSEFLIHINPIRIFQFTRFNFEFSAARYHCARQCILQNILFHPIILVNVKVFTHSKIWPLISIYIFSSVRLLVCGMRCVFLFIYSAAKRWSAILIHFKRYKQIKTGESILAMIQEVNHNSDITTSMAGRR